MNQEDLSELRRLEAQRRAVEIGLLLDNSLVVGGATMLDHFLSAFDEMTSRDVRRALKESSSASQIAITLARAGVLSIDNALRIAFSEAVRFDIPLGAQSDAIADAMTQMAKKSGYKVPPAALKRTIIDALKEHFTIDGALTAIRQYLGQPSQAQLQAIPGLQPGENFLP